MRDAADLLDPDHLRAPGPAGYRRGKRLLDIGAVVILAPLAAPIVAVAGAVILLTMGWPVFFSQPRVGLGGREFLILKLRTMRKAGPAGERATAIGDGRVTPFGRWLRRFHIDELPQLWNVLAGEMSLVGPRPEQPGLAAAYAQQAPGFAYRQLVRPGITGWAQVHAGYAGDLEEIRVRLVYDLHYLRNVSFGLDLEICVRTIWVVVSGRGAR